MQILMNLESQEKELELGPVLSDFKEFTKSFDPSMKGLALSNSETIRSVHNSFSRQQVYELDGLKEGPLDLGVIPEGKDWTEFVTVVLQDRINKYSEGEIHFNLMAV